MALHRHKRASHLPGHVKPDSERVRTGKDAGQVGLPSQSGPNRGTNTGSAAPGGVRASSKAGVTKSGGAEPGDAQRKGPVTIPGASRGATKISGVNVGGRAQRG